MYVYIHIYCNIQICIDVYAPPSKNMPYGRHQPIPHAPPSKNKPYGRHQPIPHAPPSKNKPFGRHQPNLHAPPTKSTEKRCTSPYEHHLPPQAGYLSKSSRNIAGT